ncbi:MAG: ABC transporter ATP-binding protein, partial [Thermotogales bacterium]|nr:ABC transporter ATP-binding protein [Thermotogales bacterium]
QAVPGIQHVEPLGETRARLLFEKDNPADAVAACVASQGWGLVELSLDRQTLEQVFVDLTCTDTPAPSEVAA